MSGPDAEAVSDAGGVPTDRRLLRSNGRVADAALQGLVRADRFVTPVLHRVRRPVAPLNTRPAITGPRDRELAFGQGFFVLEIDGDHAFGYAERDGHVGYVPAADLSERQFAPTHRVTAPTYWASEPSLKVPSQVEPLPVGAQVTVFATHHDHCDWAEVHLPPADPQAKGGAVYVPMPHLAPLTPATDPVAEAERYLGAPYLWGGNSGWGIDCSGLVQAACLACGIACPGDSDQQAAALGQALPPDADLRRNDLIFWKGHVAWVTGDGRILHANAHHMAVAHEDMSQAIARIAAAGDPVTLRRRL